VKGGLAQPSVVPHVGVGGLRGVEHVAHRGVVDPTQPVGWRTHSRPDDGPRLGPTSRAGRGPDLAFGKDGLCGSLGLGHCSFPWMRAIQAMAHFMPCSHFLQSHRPMASGVAPEGAGRSQPTQAMAEPDAWWFSGAMSGFFCWLGSVEILVVFAGDQLKPRGPTSSFSNFGHSRPRWCQGRAASSLIRRVKFWTGLSGSLFSRKARVSA